MAVVLDPFQTIVNVGWAAGDFVLINFVGYPELSAGAGAGLSSIELSLVFPEEDIKANLDNQGETGIKDRYVSSLTMGGITTEPFEHFRAVDFFAFFINISKIAKDYSEEILDGGLPIAFSVAYGGYPPEPENVGISPTAKIKWQHYNKSAIDQLETYGMDAFARISSVDRTFPTLFDGIFDALTIPGEGLVAEGIVFPARTPREAYGLKYEWAWDFKNRKNTDDFPPDGAQPSLSEIT